MVEKTMAGRDRTGRRKETVSMVESILMGKDQARESHRPAMREWRGVTGETQRQREDICYGRDESADG
jgi:hypothetical protein